jgi:hypothetical protein
MRDAEFHRKYFGQLVGAKIIDFILTEDEDGFYAWPTFKAELRDGTVVVLELSQDQEGNGPGWLFGLPDPR